MSRMWAILRPLLAIAVAVGSVVAAPSTFAGDGEAQQAFRSYRRAVEKPWLDADVSAERFFEAVDDAVAQAEGDRFRLTWNRGIHDLTGDGAQEVLLERWLLAFDPVGFGLSGDYRALVVDGRRGDRMWTYRDELHGGFPLLAMGIDLAEGEPGLLFPEADNQSAESPTYRATFEAVDARGESRWTRSFTTTYNLVTGGIAGTDVPTAFDVFEPDGDDTTELLVALTDYVRASIPDKAVARSEVYALDGADGSLLPLGTVGPDLHWFHSIQGGPDVDGRGGDDFVVAGNENTPDAYLEVRSGLTGDVVWRKAARFGWYPWASGVPDMTSDGRPDLVIGWERPNTDERVFQVWDAQKARPVWKAEGIFPYLLGDQDRDGTIDIGAFEFIREDGRYGARFLAFSRGRLLYERSHVENLAPCQSSCFSAGFYLSAGDLDGDSLRDTYVLANVPDGDGMRVVEYAVRGADGRLLYERRRLTPVRGSIDGGRGGDLLGFALAGPNRLLLTAYDGITRAVLWSRTYRMAGLRNLGPYGAYDAADRLDRDPQHELLVAFSARRAQTLAALDAHSGDVLWQKAVTGAARVRATSP